MKRQAKINCVKEVDAVACEANGLWHRAESLKLKLAARFGISPDELASEGIYIPGREVRRGGAK